MAALDLNQVIRVSNKVKPLKENIFLSMEKSKKKLGFHIGLKLNKSA